MGFLGLGKRGPPRPVKTLWPHEEVKWSHIWDELSRAHSAGRPVFILVSFVDTGLRIVKHLKESGIEAQEAPSIPETKPAPGSVHVIPASLLSSDFLDEERPTREDPQSVLLLIPELSPFKEEESLIVKIISALPYAVEVAHHISLDDPLVTVFIGAQVKNMLLKLGLSEHEPISSKMFDRAILKAQERLGSKAGPNAAMATNAVEWIEVNFGQRIDEGKSVL